MIEVTLELLELYTETSTTYRTKRLIRVTAKTGYNGFTWYRDAKEIIVLGIDMPINSANKNTQRCAWFHRAGTYRVIV